MPASKTKGLRSKISKLREQVAEAKVEHELTGSEVTRLILLRKQQEYCLHASQEEYETKSNRLVDALRSTDDEFLRRALLEKQKVLDESHDVLVAKMEKDINLTTKMVARLVH